MKLRKAGFNPTQNVPIKIPDKFYSKNTIIQATIEKLRTECAINEQQKLIKMLLQYSSNAVDSEFSTLLLTYLFLTVDTKHPIRKTISRVLLTANNDLVRKTLSENILFLINTDKGNKDFCYQSNHEIIIDLQNCFNNFPLGIESISDITDYVTPYVINLFLYHGDKLSNSIGNQTEIENSHSFIYSITKLLVSLVQQCTLSTLLANYSGDLMFTSYKIIMDDYLSFDIKCNCGVLLVIAVIHIPNQAMTEFKSKRCLNLLKLDKTNDNAGLLDFKNLTENYTANLCVYSGILNVVPQNILCEELIDGIPVISFMFGKLIDYAKRSTGKPSQMLEVSRALILISKIMNTIPLTYVDLMFSQGLDYVWTHLDHFVDTVKNSAKSIFENLIKLAYRHYINGCTHLMKMILTNTIDLLVNRSTHYVVLSIISAETGCSFLLEQFSRLPFILLKNIVDLSVAPQICTTYESLMAQHAKEETDINKWLELWVDLVKPLLVRIHYRHHNGANELGALLGCLKFARKSGLVLSLEDNSENNVSTDNKKCWRGYIELEFLQTIMCHQSDEELQEHLFKLFDQDGDGELIQEDWIEFLKVRLTDRHIHFIEHLESVVYCRCGDGPITVDKFSEILKTKGIIDTFFKLIDYDNAGLVTSEKIMEFLATITTARPHTGFDKGSLERLEKLFKETVGTEKEIRKEDFTKIVNSKNPFFTKRVFDIFDRDCSGSISFQEFLDAMHQFSGKTPEDKIKFLFRVYDLDGDGLIQRKELQDVMTACMHENGMKFSPDQIEDLTSAMIEDAGTNNKDAITYEALKNQLEKHGGLLENLSISIDRWLLPAKPKPPATIMERIKQAVPYQITKPYLKNNYEYVIFLSCVVIVNVSLFISRAIEYYYRGENNYVIFARACGQCLNFNCVFILVLMLRQSITYLRSRGFSMILPLDQHIYFHKQAGYLITFYSALHTIMHSFNLDVILKKNSLINVNDTEECSGNHTQTCTAVDFLFTTKPGFGGLIPGLAFPTGIVLIIILTIMFICSQPFVRRRGSFQVFYWTHTLYIPFWILLILHCKNFWKWFILPGTIFVIERLIRFSWIKSGRGKSYITSGVLLSSKVVNLQIKRPTHFDFHPGDYIFANIPAIAKYEWHPFTISSAPEQEDSIWLHIRAVGEWTNKLYEYFREEQEKLEAQTMLTENPQATIIPSPEPQSPIKRFQATVRRTFSKKDDTAKPVQLIGFNHKGLHYENRANASASDGELNNAASCSTELYDSSQKTGPESKFHRLFSSAKAPPLSKSLSMPDMQAKKKKERSLVLKDYMRSESEKSFDESQIKKARLRSLCIMYMSQHNKSLAQSFRYMRNKPTIIAFKTPSMEKCDSTNASTSELAVSVEKKTDYYDDNLERRAEEGRMFPLVELPKGATVNYPIGKPLEIILDGPYGAPSSHIFRAQHAVLIATGIGVTPFASILQSIMFRYWKARHTCPNCKHSFSSDIPRSIMNLKKVDFFWINRNQESFEWFISLLSKLEIEQAELGGAMERFLDMHMYITSALQKSDMKAVGLQLALDLLHQKEKRDLITGLKTRTNAGRPNWDKVFNQISKQKKGKVTVFFCGPPQIGRDLRVRCNEYGFTFRKEVF
ncbi:Ferric reductase NAD binding domain [Popillia japonica]|uniref:Ferric reductase NAD binding domain n=1 Tax=Popillia japonica TaxID=7064 RepID=A0AAW1L247_POPJA